MAVPSIPANVLRWYSLPPLARWPERADKSALGTLPTRAYRYCDVITAASGLGWYVYAPMDFALLFDGAAVYCQFGEDAQWRELSELPFPGLDEKMAAHAPVHLRNVSPSFLTALREPGVVQIWTGLLVRTAPGWSSFLRAPSNLPRPGGFEQFEGIVETDRWFGSLFTNIRLTRTDVPVRFTTDMPLIQLTPIPRFLYGDAVRAASPDDLTRIGAWQEEDWAAYDASFVAPARDPARQVGRYAIEARKLRRSACPMGHGAAAD